MKRPMPESISHSRPKATIPRGLSSDQIRVLIKAGATAEALVIFAKILEGGKVPMSAVVRSRRYRARKKARLAGA